MLNWGMFTFSFFLHKSVWIWAVEGNSTYDRNHASLKINIFYFYITTIVLKMIITKLIYCYAKKFSFFIFLNSYNLDMKKDVLSSC